MFVTFKRKKTEKQGQNADKSNFKTVYAPFIEMQYVA